MKEKGKGAWIKCISAEDNELSRPLSYFHCTVAVPVAHHRDALPSWRLHKNRLPFTLFDTLGSHFSFNPPRNPEKIFWYPTYFALSRSSLLFLECCDRMRVHDHKKSKKLQPSLSRKLPSCSNDRMTQDSNLLGDEIVVCYPREIGSDPMICVYEYFYCPPANCVWEPAQTSIIRTNYFLLEFFLADIIMNYPARIYHPSLYNLDKLSQRADFKLTHF